MRVLTSEEIKNKLEKHALWLEDHDTGECADFSYIDFTGIDFSFRDLDLRYADFREAQLQHANFREAQLQHANFRGAQLQGADFREAQLQGAYFRDADLQYADFRFAQLQHADFREAQLQHANFRGAQLQGSDFRGADLRGADIDFSCLPLWCGGLEWKIDERIAAQIAYHFCSMKCDSEKFIKARNSMIEFANEFHIVKSGDCEELTPVSLAIKE
jgi:hypothetical protein